MKEYIKYLPTKSDIIEHVTTPQICFLELSFVLLTVLQVFVVYRVLLDIAPFPVFLTFFALAQGLAIAYVLGEAGQEFSKFAYFPKVAINTELCASLILPTIAYVAMLVSTNMLIHHTPAVAAYPVIVSGAVVTHHLMRYLGCGEEYLLLRWKSVGLIAVAFFFGCLDPNTVGSTVIIYALAHAVASAIFRAGYLQKAMHIVQGRGNVLHNHQHLIGLFLLAPLVFLCGESDLFYKLPFDVTNWRTFKVWGCIALCGYLPFAKNVVSNRLIRTTGQGPWRLLEIVSVLGIFLFGSMISLRRMNLFGVISLLLVIGGRTLCAIDVQRNAERLAGARKDPASSDSPAADPVSYQEAP